MPATEKITTLKICHQNTDECPIAAEIRHLRTECKRLQELSRVDALTDLYNFGYLLDALEREMERTKRTGLPTGLIMLDLDHFKLINDNFGHENGNKAIRFVSDTIRDNIRRIDIPCRYGGEEFTIILPGIRLSQAIRAAERLRISMENNPLMINGELIWLTASFGVDSYRSDESISGEGFIERVDEFLLEAKQEGRNRVCHHEGKAVEETTEVTNEERESLVFTQFNRD